ncbi:MAG: hypothetical protein WB566_17930 [Terriglobales bacterium]
MSINRPIVLILTSDPVFSREITAHWPQEPAPHSGAPDFIVLDAAFARDLNGSNYDLAIADAADVDDVPRIQHLKQPLAAAGKPAIVIHFHTAADFYNFSSPNDGVLELSREAQFWPAIAGLMGREILRRRQAEARTRDAETTAAGAHADATLGRYMLEMRTNINNALTSVLGNAELLALEPGLPASVQAQADTIRNMALRLHEIFRRFSSIEKELTVTARETGKKTAHTVAGGH